MAKVLNISKLTKVNRSVVIEGKSYTVREMQVRDYIELTATADRLRDENAPLAVQLSENIKSIMGMTDIPESVLREMTLEELAIVSSFVRGIDAGDVTETEDEQKK